MAGDTAPPGVKPIPSSLIKGKLVQNVGKTSLIDEGKLERTTDHEISLAFEIAPFGKELRNTSAFWTGPISAVKATESDIFKGGSESISFTWKVDPMMVLFAPNQFVSAWGDGIDSVRQGYIQVSPPLTDPSYLDDPTKSWCYRFVLAAESYDEFRVILETVPTTLAALKKCPWAETLLTGGCEIDRWKATTHQTLPSEYGPGILPFLHDMRLPKYEKECLLPESSAIRSKVTETLSMMGTSEALEDDEWEDYNPSEKKRSPSFPEIAAVEEGSIISRKRKIQEEPTNQSGNMERMKDLLSGFLGGSMTVDELKALGLGSMGGVTKKSLVSEDANAGEKSERGTFDTPASLDMDVSSFMSKMPPGMCRNKVRQMTFKDIDKVMKLSENMGAEDRAEALYQSVTETKVIPEAEHNRKDKLHPAMFLPGSLAAPEVYWAECVPLRVEPHITGIPLAHVGMENLVAPLAIQKAGDRTKRLYIRYFLQSNVNIQQKQPKFKTHRGQDGAMGMSMDENWLEAQKVSEIQDAVFAYMFVMADLHPRVYGPRNLLRLLHKLDWLAFRTDQLFALKLVIDAVLGRYQYLAEQKKPDLSYKELQDFVSAVLASKGGPTKPPDVSLVRLTREDYGGNHYANDGRGRGRGSVWRGGRGGLSAAVGPSAAAGYSATRVVQETPSLCHAYNSPSGCSRDSSGRRCFLSSGKCLLHLCSKTNANGDACMEAHAKHDHK